ncbi:hypothetical protein [Dyella sp.]|uniref:hypothetical protein n=1 Tax=Dyella sp. TaxID=1869338 RepID=UPI002ED11DDB
MIMQAKMEDHSTMSGGLGGGRSGVTAYASAGARQPGSLALVSTVSQGGAVVDALLEWVERLERQLQREQQELKAASAQQRSDIPATLARKASAQAAVSTTLGQLQEVMGRLAETLNQIGDSASGSLLDTSA